MKSPPWIIQCYVQDKSSMAYLYQLVESYIQPTAQDSCFKENYLKLIREHCDWLGQEDGIFFDDKVLDGNFEGGERQVIMTIYRQYSPKMALTRGRSNLQDLNQAATRLQSKLQGVGIDVERLGGHDFRDWLLHWFNPRLKLKQPPDYPDDKESLPFGYDFAEQLFYSVPESSQEEGLWYFDKLPHRYLTIQQLSKVPDLGQVTRERAFGQYRYGLFDKLPTGTTFVMTVVLQSQEIVKNHLARIEESARKTNSTAALITYEDCQIAKAAIEKGNYLLPTTMGLYIRGDNVEDLADKELQIDSLLGNHGFHFLNQDHELLPIHSYLNQLPFCYQLYVR